MVGREAVRGTTGVWILVLVLVLVWTHSILYEQTLRPSVALEKRAMLAVAVAGGNGEVCCVSVQIL